MSKSNFFDDFKFFVRPLLPSKIFFLTYLFFNFFPALFLYFSDYYEGLYGVTNDLKYFAALKLNFQIVLLFGVIYLLGSIIFKVIYKIKSNKNSHIIVGREKNIESVNIIFNGHFRLVKKTSNNILIIGYIGILIIVCYFAMGGYQKLLLLGQDVEEWEFRIISYDDRSRVLIALFELSRRFILPFVASYFLTLNYLKVKYLSKFNFFIILFSLLLGGVMTLDRGPILLFFIMFIYVKTVFNSSLKFYFIFGFLSICFIFLLASVLTYVQYNKLDFSFDLILGSAINFLWHRTILVPSIAAVELSYYNFPFFSSKLLFAYSRLGALFGNDYIAIGNDNSLYVTPVGFIADIWRNIGLFGIVICAMVLSWYFRYLDFLQSNLDLISQVPFSFTVVSLCFFLIFGVFFSQGVFVHLFLLVMVIKFISKPIKM